VDKMKKGFLKGIALLSFFLFFVVFGAREVSAENELNNMYIEVELQEDGSGVVTEHRLMDMDEGTELFIDLENMQDSELLDFSVRNFTEVEEWDSDASREEKAGKYGIIDTDDGQELVWGIGEYGENTYELTYTLSNLVRELEDGQGLLWNFDTFSDIPAQNLSVNIQGYEPFTQENVNFWGFGFEGNMNLRNGDIVWTADQEVDDGDKVTPLLQFPSGYFDTQASVDMTLEEQYEMAADGSAYNDDDSLGLVETIFLAGVFIIIAAVIILVIVYSVQLSNRKKEAGSLITGNKRIKMNKDKYYKQVPYEGESLADISFLLKGIYTGYFEDYFAAFLLKWVGEGKIDIQTEEKDVFFGKKQKSQLEILNHEQAFEDFPLSFKEFSEDVEVHLKDKPYEFGIWLMLVDAADSEGVVTDEAIEIWADNHASEVEVFADYLYEYSKEELENQQLIHSDEIQVWGMTQEIAVSTPQAADLYNQLVQFRNYLKDTGIEQFADNNQGISFEEVMVWSILFGKSDEMTKKLDDLIPENDGPTSYYYPYWYTFHGTTAFRNEWSSGLSSGGFNSQASGGSGGATSAGGGAGAGGGGGGGAR